MCRTRSVTASVSAAVRSAPSRAATSAAASAGASTSSGSGRAPATTSPVSCDRLVTRTMQPPLPGSSGRTWSASRALSSSSSIRLPASQVRSSALRGVEVGRDLLGGHPEGVEEPLEGGTGGHRRPGRVEPAQVDVELAVGEEGRRLPGKPDREGGLADAGGPGDQRDRGRRGDGAGSRSRRSRGTGDGGGRRRLRGRQQHPQPAEFGRPADEAVGLGWQLGGAADGDARLGPGRRLQPFAVDQEARPVRGPGDRGRHRDATRRRKLGRPDLLGPVRAGHRRGPRLQGRVHRQQPLVDAGQLAARVDAEVFGQPLAGVVEDPERFGLAAATVERDHEEAAGALTQWIARHQGGQLGHGGRVLPLGEQQVGPFLEGGRAQLGQPPPFGFGKRPRDPGKGLAAPQLQRLVGHPGGAAQVPGRPQPPRLAQPLLELARVEAAVAQPEQVAAVGRDQHPGRGPAGTRPSTGLAGPVRGHGAARPRRCRRLPRRWPGRGLPRPHPPAVRGTPPGSPCSPASRARQVAWAAQPSLHGHRARP